MARRATGAGKTDGQVRHADARVADSSSLCMLSTDNFFITVAMAVNILRAADIASPMYSSSNRNRFT